MFLGFQIIPYLIKEEQCEKSDKCSDDDDKSGDAEKEDKPLSEVCYEGDGDNPVNPYFGKGLEIILDGLIELIQLFDDPHCDKCHCRDTGICHGLLLRNE